MRRPSGIHSGKSLTALVVTRCRTPSDRLNLQMSGWASRRKAIATCAPSGERRGCKKIPGGTPKLRTSPLRFTTTGSERSPARAPPVSHTTVPFCATLKEAAEPGPSEVRTPSATTVGLPEALSEPASVGDGHYADLRRIPHQPSLEDGDERVRVSWQGSRKGVANVVSGRVRCCEHAFLSLFSVTDPDCLGAREEKTLVVQPGYRHVSNDDGGHRTRRAAQ